MFRKITLIIPTHNRHQYLLRILKYYKNTGMKILVADSSKESFSIGEKNKVEYFHYANFSFIQKVVDIFQKVDTPYVVFCSDDDFITPNGIERSMEFLENHKDYSCAHGLYIAFKPQNGDNGKVEIHWESIYRSISITADEAEERLFGHLNNYEPTFYGVHRADQLKLAFNETSKILSDYRFVELVPSALTAILGKIKILDILYCAREDHVKENKPLTWYETMKEEHFRDQYNKIIKCLAECLTNTNSINLGDAEEKVDRILTRYIVTNAGINIFLRAKYKAYDDFFKFMKPNLEKIGLYKAVKDFVYFPYNLRKRLSTEEENDKLVLRIISPTSPFYNDFLKISECISENPCLRS